MTTAEIPIVVVGGSVSCAACGRPLTDEVSQTIGMGECCRSTYKWRHISSLAEETAKAVRLIIHQIADDRLRGDELRHAIFYLYELGFVELSQRIESRLGRYTVTVEAQAPAPPPAVNQYAQPQPEVVRPLPFQPTPHQERALDAVRTMLKTGRHGVVFIVGYAGTGKAQPLTALVYTPDGPRRMGEIKLGDRVSVPTGGSARVAGVFPQGRQRVWRFTFDDGSNVESSEDHLWKVYDREWRHSTAVLRTTLDIVLHSRGHRFSVAPPAAIQFAEQRAVLNPYLLGVLLGDGCFTPANFSLAAGDTETDFRRAVGRLCTRAGGRLDATGTHRSYRIRGQGKGNPSLIRETLRDLGLWDCRAHTKFIPDEFLYTSVKNRLALLQGLMDTDGTIDKRTGSVSFSSASCRLSAAVSWLVRSLGGRASTWVKRKTTYRYKGKLRRGKPAYVVTVALPDNRKLFRLPRKRMYARSRTMTLNKRIVKTTFVGVREVQCLYIDHTDHMYVTDDFTPTHNTTVTQFMAHEHGKPVVICPTGKSALRVREATGLDAMTIHRWIYKPVEDPKTGITTFKRREGDIPVPPNRLVILDEASMVGPDLWADIYTICAQYDLRLVVIGDGFQLPPVMPPNTAPFSVLTPEFAAQLQAPRVELTEVLRQAEGSPVIRASMMLRNGAGWSAVRDLPQATPQTFWQIAHATHLQGGITICHKNVTRQQLNAGMRTMLGIQDEMPLVGEPLVCLKNTYEAGLVNGETVRFPGWRIQPSQYESVKDRWKGTEDNVRFGGVVFDDGSAATLAVEELHGRVQASPRSMQIAAKRWAQLENFYVDDDVAPHVSANFAYAWTAHKAQGSDWPYVVIMLEPSIRLNEEEGRRWCYTSLTRARLAAAIYPGRL